MWLPRFARIVWRPVLFTAALAAMSSYSSADTIVSVTDAAVPVNRASFFLGGGNSNVVATSWTQSAGFSNVTIDASLVSTESDFLSGTAYLMSAIGPGTTTNSEVVAPANFTAPLDARNGSAPLTVLFSGLSLGPGTYYLVLSAPFSNEIPGQSPLDWQIATEPVITTATSAAIGNNFLANTVDSIVDPFPPASSFLLANPQDPPLFDVTSVPEPKISVLVLGALGLLILFSIQKQKTPSD